MNKKKDLMKVASREKRFSTLAKQEAKGNEKVLKEEVKKGQTASAKDSKWEVKVDKQFASERMKRAGAAKKKAK
jgi:hypothetical protein